MILHITAKFLFGLGLGVLLSDYLQGLGWWLIILAVVMSIPGGYKVLKGK